MQTLMQKQL